MSVLEKVQKMMVEAMKARDQQQLDALRMIKTALTKHRVDTGKELDENEEMKVLNMLLKQRQEAAQMYREAGRVDLAEKEEAEIQLLESLLPPAATEEEMDQAVEEAIQETGATTLKQMGAVMKAAQEKLAGKFIDRRVLSEKVRARLSST